jgi:hypothetical protein
LDSLKNDFSTLDNSVRQSFNDRNSLKEQFATLKSDVDRLAADVATKTAVTNVKSEADTSYLTAMVNGLSHKVFEIEKNVLIFDQKSRNSKDFSENGNLESFKEVEVSKFQNFCRRL